MKKPLTLSALLLSIFTLAALFILQGCSTQEGQVDAETNEEIKQIDTAIDAVKEDTYSENTLSGF